MSQKINVNIRIDKDLKDNASLLANQLGTNLSTILNMFLVKFTIEKKFEIGTGNISDTQFINFDNNEAQQLESLDNFNSFISSVKGKQY
ncbi:MAG: hypothetical protein PHZ26_02810 [Candidatus Gracilibacteria bacterium]|nr:hypothetical protein [Candidatus Gracilibacteria bacterium]MDD2908663.1 hypothetical protein [Candidatus Gracilibacteria bacterium]